MAQNKMKKKKKHGICQTLHRLRMKCLTDKNYIYNVNLHCMYPAAVTVLDTQRVLN